MKTTIRLQLLLLMLISLLSLFVACGAQNEGKFADERYDTTAEAPTEESTEKAEPCLRINDTWRVVISSDSDEMVRKAADYLTAVFKDKTGIELMIVTDDSAPTSHEIVLGQTNRTHYTVEDGNYSFFQDEESLYIDSVNSVELYYYVLAVTEAWLSYDLGLTDSDEVILMQSSIPELNGLPAKRDAAIKVMSQNLRCNDDPDGNSVDARARRFKKMFEEYLPDLLGTQETTYKWNHYLERIAGDGYAMVGCSRDGRDATTGEWNTILYRKDRFELLDSDTTWLSYTPNDVSKVEGAICNRICTWALLKDRLTGETILFANTHLDHSNDTVRAEQMEILIDYLIERVGQYPLYLTGDFNCKVNSTPYEIATSCFLDSHKTAWNDISTVSNTFHGYKEGGKNEIDFIFHNEYTTPVQYEIISGDYDGFVSDHYGVIVEFIND